MAQGDRAGHRALQAALRQVRVRQRLLAAAERRGDPQAAAAHRQLLQDLQRQAQRARQRLTAPSPSTLHYFRGPGIIDLRGTTDKPLKEERTP